MIRIAFLSVYCESASCVVVVVVVELLLLLVVAGCAKAAFAAAAGGREKSSCCVQSRSIKWSASLNRYLRIMRLIGKQV